MGAGGAYLWGDNGGPGQLGDGTTSDQVTPLPALGMRHGIVAIAGGYFHTVALRADGTVWAWGENTQGQLGIGLPPVAAPGPRLTPVRTQGLTQVVKLAAAGGHNLAIRSDGTLWAWGYNAFGQLGTGTTMNSGTPAQITNLIDVIAIAAGAGHSLAIRDDHTLWAWGLNNAGQLGDGTPVWRSVPVQVATFKDVSAVAGGLRHSLAVRQGRVWAWGENTYGQLGDGTTAGRLTPVPVGGLFRITAVAAGGEHSLARRADGRVWSWGRNSDGRLGDGGTADRTTPAPVGSLTEVRGVGAGEAHSLLRRVDGTVWACGSNGDGQLGDGTTTDRSTSVQVTGLPMAVGLAAGWKHSMSVAGPAAGTTSAWGSNSNGQLGDGTTTDRGEPVPVGPIRGSVFAVAGGESHALALTSSGEVWTWGHNGSGQLGDGTMTDRWTPAPVSGLTGLTVAAIAVGRHHSLALMPDGGVAAWGGNGSGQLGDGSTTASSIPVPVAGLTDVVAIAAGIGHSIALRGDGSVWAWGANSVGQLGDGSTSSGSPTPTPISNLRSISALAAAGSHNLALSTDGEVRAWGLNDLGQLGDGTTVNRLSPTLVNFGGRMAAIAAGTWSSLALASDRSVWDWGYDGIGPISSGQPVPGPNGIATPVHVAGLANVEAISAGDRHSLALLVDGTIRGWGGNGSGQLGNGTTASSPAPVAVLSLSDAVAVVAGGRASYAVM